MSELSNLPFETKKSSKKWIFGLLGVASAVALGIIVSKKLPKRDSSNHKKLDFSSRWNDLKEGGERLASPMHEKGVDILETIDKLLHHNGISGIQVYLRGNTALLISGAHHASDLELATVLIRKIDGIQEVQSVVLEDTPKS
ncbi:MAG: hypothetical protein SFU91_11935 [Chloroherpetonaceae bacterium]|nr:hypothetical protein [Chloroherpetonaceae bacterium]